MVSWPSGLRRWFKAPVSSEAWVRIPLSSGSFCHSYLLVDDACEVLEDGLHARDVALQLLQRLEMFFLSLFLCSLPFPHTFPFPLIML